MLNTIEAFPNGRSTSELYALLDVDFDVQKRAAIRAELDETKIVPAAAELEEGHDIVVIDTAGSATQATVFAIGCADVVLVPIQASSADVIEAIKTMRLIESAAKMVRREIPAMVVFTDYQPNTNVSAHTRREVTKYGMFMLRTKLNRLVAFRGAHATNTMEQD